MYCSACGTAVISGLSYCNKCGARLRESSEVVTVRDNEIKSSETFSESLVWAMVAVFVVGIGCVIGLMAVMKEVLHFDVPIILSVLAVCFFLIFLLEGVFIWLLFSSRRAALRTAATSGVDNSRQQAMTAAGNNSGGAVSSSSSSGDLETNDLYAPPAAAALLSESQDIPSVVEHTTHSLEPVLIERKSK